MKSCQSAAAYSRQPHHPVTHTGQVLLDLLDYLGITDQDITALTPHYQAGQLLMLPVERVPEKAFITGSQARFRLVAEDAPTPAAPPLDLDAMQAQAQQRVQEWIAQEAAQLSKDSYRWFVGAVGEDGPALVGLKSPMGGAMGAAA